MRFTNKATFWFAVCSILVVWLGAVCHAQVYYGTIRGTVMDSSGAIAPGVTVDITNVDTNISQKVVSNQVGNYVAPNLIPGNYRVTVEMAGFKRFVAAGIELVATADRRVDVRLDLGNVSESVTVTEGAQLVETEKGEIADVKPLQELQYIPVNSNYRSAWNIVMQAPAVNGSYGSTYAGAGDGGNGGYDTAFTIDGIPATDGWTGWTFGTMFTYIDSYSEMQVRVAGSNASSGQSSGVELFSQSGTNAFHGEGWLSYNAMGFQARNTFADTSPHGPPTYRPSVKFGGPVILPKIYNGKNRTFFFFTWQGIRGSQSSPAVANLLVPDSNLRQGVFPTQIIDPTTGNPFPDNTIPASRVSSVSTYYQDNFFPVANAEGNRYHDSKIFSQGNNYYNTRFDQKLTEKNSFFFRFLISRSVPSNGWDNGDPLIGEYTSYRNDSQQVFSDTHVISPTMVNEFRWGHSKDLSEYHGANYGPDVVSASGLQLGSNLPAVYAMPQMDINGYNSLGQTGLGGWSWDTYSYQDALHIVRGKHNISVGLQFTKFDGAMTWTSPSSVYGDFGFDGRFTGSPYADFLLGIPATSGRQTSVSPVYPSRLNKEFYVTDDWKIAPRLTLNFGLRYSLFGPIWVDKGVFGTFDPTATNTIGTAQATPGAMVIPDSAQSLVASEYLDAPLVLASQAGLSQNLMNTDKNNFAPRFGFAWRPTTSNKFVIRGGAGIYYVSMQPNNLGDGGGAPFEVYETYNNSITNGVPLFAFPNPFPASTQVSGSGGFSVSGEDPNLRTPYSIQTNLTVERQMLGMGISASFISTQARKTPFSYNLNAIPANTTPYDVKAAQIPYPFFWSANYLINEGSHNYRAGILKAERSFANGLYYQTYLTWSKSIGDDVAYNQDPFNRAADRGASPNIPPFRFVASVLYDLPAGKGKRFGSSMPKVADYLLGGWRLSLNYQWENGDYLTPYFSGTDPANTGAFYGRADCLANGNLPKSQRTIGQYFDTSAFTFPADGSGRYGNCGNSILQGPGLSVLNAALMKEIGLGERVKMRMEIVSTNVANHPIYGDPNTTLDSALAESGVAPAQQALYNGYGVISGLKGYTSSPRNLSLTLRLMF